MGNICSFCCSFCKEYDNTDYILLHEPEMQELIKRAITIHKGKYDYSLISIDTMDLNKDVEILCFTHGPFEMTLNQHVNNRGECPQCVDDRNSDLT